MQKLIYRAQGKNFLMAYPNIEECNYFTNRVLENEKKQKTGHILAWHLKAGGSFHIIMTCPYCAHKQERDDDTIVFGKRPYRVTCENCKKSILLEKMYKKQKDKSSDA